MKPYRKFHCLCSTILIAIACIAGSADCAALDGAWRGDLSVNGTRLPLVFHFSKNPAGQQQCTMDSPMQNTTGIKAKVQYCSADSVALQISFLKVTYRGRVSADKIEGEFVQGGLSFPLTLTPEQPLSERRPQTPKPPYPYSTTDTTFAAADGVMLAGTLTMPEGTVKKVPAVVMVTGSGPQNRDEEIFDHRPFAVLADWLARNGIASFRYDDRGTAQSGGDYKTAGIDTFRSDAEAALRFLKSQPAIGKTGVLGHSEGGTIALMLAADRKTDFVVSLAGLAIDGKDMIIAQNMQALEKLELSEQEKADAISLLSHCFDDIIAGKDYAAIDADGYVEELQLDVPPIILISLKQNMQAAQGSYFRQLLQLSPQGWLKKIKCPVLALNGASDKQVYSAENLQAVSRQVKGSRVKEYPGLNHLFQHCTTGDPSEYINISETVSPEVMEDIVEYIKGL